MGSRILLIEDDPVFRELTAATLEQAGYEVELAADGETGLELARRESFDAIVVDLMMPRMHGFEVIQRLRGHYQTFRTPLLVYSAKIYESDQRKVIALGADGFLQKPVSADSLQAALDEALQCVKVTFWGVRGSVAAPGPETVRYGGNTPCVTVDYGGRTLILDAGTGIRKLGLVLQAEAREEPIDLDLLITHTHWDHIQGFPYFVPAYHPRNTVRVHGPRSLSKPLDKVLRGQMDPEYFPVALGDMAANIIVQDVREEVIDLGVFQVRHTFMNHPGVTLGYRIEVGGAAIAYATDTEVFTRLLQHTLEDKNQAEGMGRRMDDDLANLVKGADLYIGDAQYTPEEYKGKVGWGHSSCEDAVRLAVYAGAKRFALFSHDPMQDDDAVDIKVQQCRDLVVELDGTTEVFGAYEGQTVTIQDSALKSSSE